MDSLLLNFLFYLCVVFLILLNCLCFLVAHCLLKTAFLNYLCSALESYHLSLSLGSVIRRLLWPLVVSYFLDISRSWSFALLTSHLNSNHFLRSLGEKYLLSALLEILGYPFMGTPPLCLLVSLVAEFLSCLFSMGPLKYQVECFVFPKMALKLTFVVSSWTTD